MARRTFLHSTSEEYSKRSIELTRKQKQMMKLIYFWFLSKFLSEVLIIFTVLSKNRNCIQARKENIKIHFCEATTTRSVYFILDKKRL